MSDSTSGPLALPEIEAVLDEFRPRLQMDGADLLVLDLDAGLLRLRMSGRTSCCPVALSLLQSCLEKTLRERIPAIHRLTIER